jgi:hypothetical protein
LDKRGSVVPSDQLSNSLSEVCIPVAGKCILKLQMGQRLVGTADELMIEFELCIGLIFKPLRHHLSSLAASGSSSLPLVWKSVLSVLENLLLDDASEETKPVIPDNLITTMRNLANEHFRNAVVVLYSTGFLENGESRAPGDITTSTLDAAKRMGIGEDVVQEWQKQTAPLHD